MCLIVDVNCFQLVFSRNPRFAPVFKWLMSDFGGRLIYGGEKYKREVRPYLKQFLGVLGELERKGRVVRLRDRDVDESAMVLKKKEPDPDFDDEHIVAMVGISKCCVVCTDDRRAVRFLRRRDLYPEGVKPPKIYRSERNAHLCSRKNVVGICLPEKRG